MPAMLTITFVAATGMMQTETAIMDVIKMVTMMMMMMMIGNAAVTPFLHR